MTETKRPKVEFVFNAELIRIVDGDTLELSIDRGFSDHTRMMARLYGCDTPETRGPEAEAGKWVATQVAAWFGDRRDVVCHSVRYRRDSFGRSLFHVWLDDKCITDWLLAKGYAWRTDEAGKVIGPRSVESLGLPEGVKQAVREAFA